MNISAQGFQLLKLYEGWRGRRYRDAGGRWTIGYGHLILPGEAFDEPITREEGEEIMARDVGHAEKYVSASLRVRVTQGMFDALVSLCYNIGVGRFGNSSLLRLINEGRPWEAVREFSSWRRAGGVVQPGLVIRRAQEALLFADSIPLPQSLAEDADYNWSRVVGPDW